MTNYSFPRIKVRNLAVKLHARAEKLLLKNRHPWIYADSIKSVSKQGNAGDIAVVFRNRANTVLGIGLYDPDSPIRIKMLHYYGKKNIDVSFFEEKINLAFEKRVPLLDQNVTGYRLIYGENDGLPGLIVDKYDEVMVMKVYSAIWFPYLEMIVDTLIGSVGCTALVFRAGRNLDTGLIGWEDGSIVYGSLENEDVLFREGSVSFMANVLKGHKTGFFLDQRKNRQIVEQLAKGKTVLDVFSYAGGFAVHALAGGAKEVTGIDVSRQALELAEANVRMNRHKGRFFTIEGDAFEVLDKLKKDKKRFDIVVIDPPSFANSGGQVELAKKKYAQLAQIGADLVSKNGVLVLASCSAKVTAPDFFATVEKVLSESRNEYRLIERTGHDIDHPISFPEGAYLKCGFYKRVE